MPFSYRSLEIPGVWVIEARRFRDERGFFEETYQQSDFAAHGIPATFSQDNHSYSVRGVLRGLHYQKEPKAQGKLVRALVGRIFDVAVDIRRQSPAFCLWIGVELSDDDGRMLYIPPGFAHGFCVLTDEAHVMYKATAEYAPDLDRGIRWDDPEIGIEWPVAQPIVSLKDAQLPLLRDVDNIL
jgi:dTDP-4-dehydrorhamnose 3,5-epimerase